MKTHANIKTRANILATITVLLITAGPTLAADPAVRCESAKLKAISKYSKCLLKADAKAVFKGEPADYTKCVEKITGSFERAETKAGPGVCPSEGGLATVLSIVDEYADYVGFLVSGLRYTDHGNGTVTDNQTGLMWQKTDGFGGLYTWTSPASFATAGTEPNGTAFTVFLYGLNRGTANYAYSPTTGC